MANTLFDYYQGLGQALPGLTERAKTYETAGLGATNTYKGTADQNAALLNTLQKTPTVTVPTKLTPTDLETKPVNPPPTVTPDTAAPDRFLAGVQASQNQFNEFTKTLNQPVETIQTEQKGLRERLIGALDKLGGKGARVQQEEATLGIPDQTKRLQELNLQIAQKTGEYNKAIENVESGTGLTTTIGGKSGQLRRQAAVEIGALTSVQQALQGNIALAQQTAQRTVDLEFEPYEAQVKTLAQQLDFISEDLSAADKKRAEALQFTLQQYQSQIDQAKQDRQSVLNLATEAAKNGADNLTVNKITQARTPEEAMQIGGPYLGKMERESAELDRRLKEAQISNIYSETNKRNSESKSSKPLTQAQVQAQGYADRVAQAHEIISGLESVGSNLKGMVSGSGFFPNALKSPERQQLEQAQRNFVNAVLRRESGAAISDSEFKNAAQQYFPQPGDSSEVLKQKAQNRVTVMSNLYREGGVDLGSAAPQQEIAINPKAVNYVNSALGHVISSGTTKAITGNNPVAGSVVKYLSSLFK